MPKDDDLNIVDRPKSILTKQDRQFLLGELDISEMSEEEERNRRYRIRKRIENGLWDLYILSEALPINDIEILFKEIYEWQEDVIVAQERDEKIPPIPELVEAWKGSIQFLVFALSGTDIAAKEMEMAISDAIYQHYLHLEEQLVDVDVEIKIDWENAEKHSIDDIENLVENDDLPSDPKKADQMLTALLRTNRITYSQFEESFQKAVND